MSSFDLVIIGAGITGLSIAHNLAQAGLSIGLIEANHALVSTSAQSAGMIAPAIEALSYPDPVSAFERLSAASAYWHHLDMVWPDALKNALDEAVPTFWRVDQDQLSWQFLQGFGVLGCDIAHHHNDDWIEVKSDTAIAPQTILRALWEGCARHKVSWLQARVLSIHDEAVSLEDGRLVKAKSIILAGGYVHESLRKELPILGGLRPIKGHLLRLPSEAWSNGVLDRARSVWRDPSGYLVNLDGLTCFGATMQPDQEDWVPESYQIEGLKLRALGFGISQEDLKSAQAQLGVRASYADMWPIIGPVEGRNLFLCSGLRRNGFVFAPQAAFEVARWCERL